MRTWWTDNRRSSHTGAIPWIAFVVSAAAVVACSACSSPKTTHHYQPEVITDQISPDKQASASDLVLAIEDFSAGSAYDEKRIVYRSTDYRFDYYHYHRWAANPGMMIGDVLREVYRATGAFRAVVGGYDSRADVVLTGRVITLEEVDVSDDEWLGRVALNLRMRDAHTGELLWDDTLRREVQLEEQSPEGLAAALSRGLTDIGVATAGELVAIGNEAVEQRPAEADDDEEPGTEADAEVTDQSADDAGSGGSAEP